MMAEDLNNVVLNLQEFAEMVIYTPKNSPSKHIKALVFRAMPQPDSTVSGRIMENQIEILISNDPVNGIPVITTAADKVLFPKNLGGTSVEWRVNRIVRQDPVSWRLLVTM